MPFDLETMDLDPNPLPVTVRIAALEAEVKRLADVQEEILSQVRSAVEQISPLLTKLESSPLFKMLGGK